MARIAYHRQFLVTSVPTIDDGEGAPRTKPCLAGSPGSADHRTGYTSQTPHPTPRGPNRPGPEPSRLKLGHARCTSIKYITLVLAGFVPIPALVAWHCFAAGDTAESPTGRGSRLQRPAHASGAAVCDCVGQMGFALSLSRWTCRFRRGMAVLRGKFRFCRMLLGEEDIIPRVLQGLRHGYTATGSCCRIMIYDQLRALPMSFGS